MSKSNYYAFNIGCILYIALSLYSYFYNVKILFVLGSISMFIAAVESLTRAKRIKNKIDINNAIDTEGDYKPVNIWPIYIISFIFLALGSIQISRIFEFNKFSNFIFAVGISIYVIYNNDKYYKVVKEYEKVKEEYIKKYGKDKFDQYEKDREDFNNSLMEKFKDINNDK